MGGGGGGGQTCVSIPATLWQSISGDDPNDLMEADRLKEWVNSGVLAEEELVKLIERRPHLNLNNVTPRYSVKRDLL